MSTNAIGDYDFPIVDVVGKFPAPLLYIGWEDHLMFCAPHCVPAPADLAFGDFMPATLEQMYSAHPDFKSINWDEVSWMKNGSPWAPQKDQSLSQNGIGHKDVLRFRTPGLTGINGSFS